MKIEQAAAMGLCRKACNFGDTRTGRCRYHDFESHNYLNLPPGECALTKEDVKTMRKEYDLRRKR